MFYIHCLIYSYTILESRIKWECTQNTLSSVSLNYKWENWGIKRFIVLPKATWFVEWCSLDTYQGLQMTLFFKWWLWDCHQHNQNLCNGPQAAAGLTSFPSRAQAADQGSLLHSDLYGKVTFGHFPDSWTQTLKNLEFHSESCTKKIPGEYQKIYCSRWEFYSSNRPVGQDVGMGL